MEIERRIIERDIIFCEDIDDESTKKLIKNIIDINTYDDIQERSIIDYKREPIKLYMTTRGGAVVDLFALFDIIKCSRTPVWIYASGQCCSSGFVLLGAAEKAFAYEHTRLMYHQLSFEYDYGKLEEQKQVVEHCKQTQEVLEKLILDNTNITKEKLEEVNREKIDWWMDAKEAKKLGVIDEIIK